MTKVLKFISIYPKKLDYSTKTGIKVSLMPTMEWCCVALIKFLFDGYIYSTILCF